MLYELLGRYKSDQNQIHIQRKSDRKTFSIEGEDSGLFIKSVPHLTGTTNINDIAHLSGLGKEIVIDIINELKKLNLILERKPKKFFSIVTNKGIKSNEISNKLINEVYLRNVCEQVEDLNEISINDNIKSIVAIADKEDTEFFNKVNTYSIINSKRWLRASIQQSCCFIGPFFSSQDGPCYECLNKSLDIPADDYINPFLGNYNFMIELIGKEMGRIYQKDTFSNTFNNQLTYDYTTLEITKKRILKSPLCRTCILKKELS